MSRPTALVLMGGGEFHNKPEHYGSVAGLLAGAAGLNITITDNWRAETVESMARYDLLVLNDSDRKPTPAQVEAIFANVKAGKPLLGMHAATSNITAAGTTELFGSSNGRAHLPFQEFTVNILDREHPITRGIDDFRIEDEPFRLALVGEGIQLLASYDGREASALFKGDPKPHHAEAHAWRIAHPRAPLLYTKQLGKGKIHVNALGHNRISMTNPAYVQLIVQGVAWLLGG